MRAHYSEFISWSPVFGGECARVSMVNERGEEYFCLLAHTEGRGYTALRKRALEALTEAIEMGIEAGEIRWR